MRKDWYQERVSEKAGMMCHGRHTSLDEGRRYLFVCHGVSGVDPRETHLGGLQHWRSFIGVGSNEMLMKRGLWDPYLHTEYPPLLVVGCSGRRIARVTTEKSVLLDRQTDSLASLVQERRYHWWGKQGLYSYRVGASNGHGKSGWPVAWQYSWDDELLLRIRTPRDFRRGFWR